MNKTPLVCLTAILSTALAQAAPLDFHADVAPILREYCAGCHNDQDEDGDFSVETFAQLMRGGESGQGILPGKPQESLFIHTLRGTKKPFMPPKKEPQPDAAAIEILEKWIQAGAPGPEPDADESILAVLHVPEIAPATNEPGPITAMAVSPDGRLTAMARYQAVTIQERTTGKIVLQLPDLPGKVNAVHFSSDGSRLVAATGVAGLKGLAIIWDTGTGKRLHEFEAHADVLYDAELSPDGKLLATASYDERVMLRDVETGKLIHNIKEHNGAVYDLAFSPDGTVLASASGDETVKLWLVETGERLDTLNQPQGEQYAVTFTPDGKSILAAGADNRIRLWDFVSRKEAMINPVIHARFAHEDGIVSLAVSPDGERLISASADGSVKLWTLPDLVLQKVWEDHPDLISALVFHAGDQALASHLNGSVTVFNGLSASSAAEAATSASQASETPVSVADAKPHAQQEAEPNDRPDKAAPVTLPAQISGVIGSQGDRDLYRFQARKGEQWVLEVNAARNGSPLDSRVAVLDSEGKPIERVLLQAVRDSWFTFRGKDSNTSNDFRIQNWREMEINEYLYANGEVVKLWLYPRGADSGFLVYPGFGARQAWFDTTALSHALGEPCYIVREHPPEARLVPNGLPVFRIYYENDDEANQRWKQDSRLIFTAPADGEYIAAITDVREAGGADFRYDLMLRPRQEDFEVRFDEKEIKLSPGSGQQFTFKVERLDDYEGEIQIDFANVPEGLQIESPVVIQEGQSAAQGAVYASEVAELLDAEAAAKQIKVTATADIRGRKVVHPLAFPAKLSLTAEPKLTLEILPDDESVVKVPEDPAAPLEFTIEPGQTITALARATRNGFEERIELGKEDAGSNLPHGVYVDNIGLNGLLIREEETERQFFLTAAEWVPEGSRKFHLYTKAAGGQASRPAILHVRKKSGKQDLAAGE